MSGLTSNVCVDGVWFGPSYPDAGNPPSGKVTNPEAYEDGKVPEKAPAAPKEDTSEKAPTIERTARDTEGVTRDARRSTQRRGAR